MTVILNGTDLVHYRGDICTLILLLPCLCTSAHSASTGLTHQTDSRCYTQTQHQIVNLFKNTLELLIINLPSSRYPNPPKMGWLDTPVCQLITSEWLKRELQHMRDPQPWSSQRGSIDWQRLTEGRCNAPAFPDAHGWKWALCLITFSLADKLHYDSAQYVC